MRYRKLAVIFLREWAVACRRKNVANLISKKIQGNREKH